MPRFLVSYGPNTQMCCGSCHKATRVVPGPNGRVGRREVAHYQRSHVCGPASKPWDVETVEEKAS